jgi:tripartite-type tricarboxylate transporter receptor subunit TctC
MKRINLMKWVNTIAPLVLCHIFLANNFAAEISWPKKPIQLILSFPPGGSTDIMARSIATAIEPILGQAIVVENKPGAGGMIGLSAAAKSAADGYTIHVSAMTNQAISQAVFPNPPADLRKDFAPVAMLGSLPHLMEINPKIPATNLKELISYINSKNGDFNFASQGNGTLSHLEAELFLKRINSSGNHIPYKGSSFALPDLIAGNTVMMFDSISASLPYIKSGKLRPIAIAASQRTPLLPDVPTFSEAGLKNFDVENYCALYVPKGTPQEIINKLENALFQAVNNKELFNRVEAQGIHLHFESAAKLLEITQLEHEKWQKILKTTSIKID